METAEIIPKPSIIMPKVNCKCILLAPPIVIVANMKFPRPRTLVTNEYPDITDDQPTLFRDVIDNGSTKGNAYYQLYSGKKLKVLSIPQLFTWFTKTVDTLTTPEFIDELTGDTIVNDKSYMYDGRNIVQKGDSYPSHKAGGFGYQSIIGRIKILINEFNDSFDDLAKNRIISTTKSMAPTSQVFASNNYRSNAGTLIDPTKKASDKYERGHVTSRKNEGSDELGNLKPQIKKANRSYSGRNMTKKK